MSDEWKRPKKPRGRSLVIPFGDPLADPFEDTSGPYFRYGFDDFYPQRIVNLVDNSPSLELAVKEKARFIEGNGYRDEAFYQRVINYQGQKIDSLLGEVSRDCSQFQGFAIHVQYNGLLQKAGVKLMPFENMRLGVDDDRGVISKVYFVRKTKVFSRRSRNYKHNCIAYDVYNPDPEVVLSQVEKAGGIQKYKGQVYYVFFKKPGARIYPKAWFHSAIRPAETEIAALQSLHKDTTRGFRAKGMIVEYGYALEPTDDEFEEKKEEYKKVFGQDGDDIFLHMAADKETKPDFVPFSVEKQEAIYSFTLNSQRDLILDLACIPRILYGQSVAGKLGTREEFEQANNYVINHVINSERRLVEQTFEDIFGSGWSEDLNPSNDWKIENLAIESVIQAAGGTQDPAKPESGNNPKEQPKNAA